MVERRFNEPRRPRRFLPEGDAEASDGARNTALLDMERTVTV